MPGLLPGSGELLLAQAPSAEVHRCSNMIVTFAAYLRGHGLARPLNNSLYGKLATAYRQRDLIPRPVRDRAGEWYYHIRIQNRN